MKTGTLFETFIQHVNIICPQESHGELQESAEKASKVLVLKLDDEQTKYVFLFLLKFLCRARRGDLEGARGRRSEEDDEAKKAKRNRWGAETCAEVQQMTAGPTKKEGKLLLSQIGETAKNTDFVRKLRQCFEETRSIMRVNSKVTNICTGGNQRNYTFKNCTVNLVAPPDRGSSGVASQKALLPWEAPVLRDHRSRAIEGIPSMEQPIEAWYQSLRAITVDIQKQTDEITKHLRTTVEEKDLIARWRRRLELWEKMDGETMTKTKFGYEGRDLKILRGLVVEQFRMIQATDYLMIQERVPLLLNSRPPRTDLADLHNSRRNLDEKVAELKRRHVDADCVLTWYFERISADIQKQTDEIIKRIEEVKDLDQSQKEARIAKPEWQSLPAWERIRQKKKDDISLLRLCDEQKSTIEATDDLMIQERVQELLDSRPPTIDSVRDRELLDSRRNLDKEVAELKRLHGEVRLRVYHLFA